ncbi:hypothetical protein NUTIK01_17110 [Novosphingobium sp. IK01]|uniref:DUF308 domain-containing protein n=1 Tax=Novosphingobium pituita TaxID=3056842 RepID=A0ABQ6P8M2_9SPHN|nr:hypothetical protein NUTIK01_17110 [Novosphingobium sp. IK01]
MGLVGSCQKADSPSNKGTWPNVGGNAQVTRSKRKPEVKRAGGGAGRSIRAHRLFPAFTALWFAALFALASLVVPVAVIQSAVVALGLPKIVAAAAPPLGFTARVLVTLALVGLGGLLGLVVGLRLGTRKAVPADEAPVTFGRRKSGAAELAALVEEDEQGRIAEQPLVAGDPAHQDVAPQEAPLPVVSDLAGSGPVAPDAPFDAPVAAPAAPRVRARDAHPDAPPRRPLTVSDDMIDEAETRILSDDEEASLRPSREGRLFDPFAIYEDDAGDGQDEPFVPPAFLARTFDRAEQPAGPAVPAQASDEPVGEAPVDVAPEPEPAAQVSVEAVEENDEDRMTDEDGALHGDHDPLLAAHPARTGLASPVAQADLDGLGLVQLVERLALAIASHREDRDGSSMVGSSIVGRAPVFAASETVGAPVGPSDVVTMPRLSRAFDAEPRAEARIASNDGSGNDGPGNDGGVNDAGQGGVFTLARGEPAVLEDRYSSLTDVVPALRRGDDKILGDSLSGESLSGDENFAQGRPLVIFPGQARALAADGPVPARASAGDVSPAFERPVLASVPTRFQAIARGDGARTSDLDDPEQALRDALATLQKMTANR